MLVFLCFSAQNCSNEPSVDPHSFTMPSNSAQFRHGTSSRQLLKSHVESKGPASDIELDLYR